MFVMKTKCLLSPLQSTKHERLENCPNNAYTIFLTQFNHFTGIFPLFVRKYI